MARAVPRALAGATLLATVAAAALGAPSPALAAATLGVQNDRLSSSPIEVLAQEVGRVERTNARVTRFDILWSLAAPSRPANAVDPEDPAYDFRRIDLIVRELGADRIVPIVTVYSAPPWAAGGQPIPQGTEINRRAPGAAHFARFMRAVATRYSGRFTPAGASRPLPEVRHWELWNEPNLASFFSPQVQRGRRVAIRNYARLVRQAYPLIKRANRDAVVIAGVGGPRSSTDSNGTAALPWLRAVLRSGVRLDALSQHVYPAAPPLRQTPVVPTWSTVPLLIDEIDRVARHRGKSLYITEAGYTTARTPFRTVRTSPANQAKFLRQITRLPVIRRGNRVPAVIWFNLRDNPNWPGGLLRENLRAKPSYAVFQRIARGTRLHPDLRRGAARPTAR